jgi:molybdenum cofactor biosynthesis enzyme MoaA
MAQVNPYALLKLNRLVKSHRLKCLGVLAADKLGVRHLSIRLDPFLGCNLRCQMCHFSSEEYRDRKAELMSFSDYERIAGLLFPKAVQVMLGCAAEPTPHPKLPEMVEIAKRRHKVPHVGIVTNAQLLTRELAERLVRAGIDEFTISVHGVLPETYEKLQPPAKWEKLHAALGHLTDLSREGAGKFKVRINFTANPLNHAELSGFFEAFGAHKIDLLQVRKIFDLGNTVYADRNLGPYLESLERIRLELLRACRDRGTVLLCPSFLPAPARGPDLSTVLLPLLLRYVSPQGVWKDDFRWREESYEDYLVRKDWHREVLRMAMASPEKVAARIENAHRSLGYDVND